MKRITHALSIFMTLTVVAAVIAGTPNVYAQTVAVLQPATAITIKTTVNAQPVGTKFQSPAQTPNIIYEKYCKYGVPFGDPNDPLVKNCAALKACIMKYINEFPDKGDPGQDNITPKAQEAIDANCIEDAEKVMNQKESLCKKLGKDAGNLETYLDNLNSGVFDCKEIEDIIKNAKLYIADANKSEAKDCPNANRLLIAAQKILQKAEEIKNSLDGPCTEGNRPKEGQKSAAKIYDDNCTGYTPDTMERVCTDLEKCITENKGSATKKCAIQIDSVLAQVKIIKDFTCTKIKTEAQDAETIVEEFKNNHKNLDCSQVQNYVDNLETYKKHAENSENYKFCGQYIGSILTNAGNISWIKQLYPQCFENAASSKEAAPSAPTGE